MRTQHLDSEPAPECSRGQRFVVLVDWGEANLAESRRRVESLARRHFATLIPVDTSLPLHLPDGSGVNDAFEFSGYQYGLRRAMDHVERERGPITVAFVNGTAVTSHLRAMLPHALSRAFQSERPAAKVRLRGFRHRCEAPRSVVASLGFYVATFAFSVSGDAQALSGLTLYDRGAIGLEPLARRLAGAGVAYTELIDRWLSPTSFWRGWYKALPGAVVDAETHYRKRLAIYLEHSLPDWLAHQGVEYDEEQSPGAAIHDALMALDKLYVNGLKVRFRAGHALRNRIGSRG